MVLIRSRDLMIFPVRPSTLVELPAGAVLVRGAFALFPHPPVRLSIFFVWNLASKIKDNPTSEPGRIDEAAMRRSALAMWTCTVAGNRSMDCLSQFRDKLLIRFLSRDISAQWSLFGPSVPQFKYISLCLLPPVSWILRSRKISGNN